MFGLGAEKHTKTPIVTLTGEVVQPIRLHYNILNLAQVLNKLRDLKCVGTNILGRRFQWQLSHEAKDGAIKPKPDRKSGDPLTLGFIFVSEDGKNLMVRVLSIERALFALKFFDRHIGRKFLKVENLDVYNRILEASPQDQRMVADSDLLFPPDKIVVADVEEMPKLIDQWMASGMSPAEMQKVFFEHLEAMNKRPVPEMERIPVRFLCGRHRFSSFGPDAPPSYSF